MSRSLKPAIPPVPKPGEDRSRFDAAIKETLEYLTGRRRGPRIVVILDTANATAAENAAKINEILELLQG